MTLGDSLTILLVDDDRDDQLLTREALREAHIHNRIHCVNNGEELFAYLRHEAPFQDPQSYPEPGVILLDLNMPRMDGREALRLLKADARLKHIPVVILSTSRAHDDVCSSYGLGSNSYITKPTTFDRLVDALRKFGEFWMGVAELPAQPLN